MGRKTRSPASTSWQGFFFCSEVCLRCACAASGPWGQKDSQSSLLLSAAGLGLLALGGSAAAGALAGDAGRGAGWGRGGGPACRGRRWGIAAIDPEQRDHLGELHGLLAQTVCGGSGLLHQGRVLLRHLVELVHGRVDLGNALALLGRG